MILVLEVFMCILGRGEEGGGLCAINNGDDETIPHIVKSLSIFLW